MNFEQTTYQLKSHLLVANVIILAIKLLLLKTIQCLSVHFSENRIVLPYTLFELLDYYLFCDYCITQYLQHKANVAEILVFYWNYIDFISEI